MRKFIFVQKRNKVLSYSILSQSTSAFNNFVTTNLQNLKHKKRHVHKVIGCMNKIISRTVLRTIKYLAEKF